MYQHLDVLYITVLYPTDLYLTGLFICYHSISYRFILFTVLYTLYSVPNLSLGYFKLCEIQLSYIEQSSLIIQYENIFEIRQSLLDALQNNVLKEF